MIAFKNKLLCKFSNYSQFHGENQLSNTIIQPLTSNFPHLPPKAACPKDSRVQHLGDWFHSLFLHPTLSWNELSDLGKFYFQLDEREGWCLHL